MSAVQTIRRLVADGLFDSAEIDGAVVTECDTMACAHCGDLTSWDESSTISCGGGRLCRDCLADHGQGCWACL